MSSATIIVLVGLVLTFVAALTPLLLRRAGISSMAHGEFVRRLLHGWRTPGLGPEGLRELQRRLGERLLIVDLRPAGRFVAGAISGAQSRPFDDFLRELVVEGRYDADRERPIVLVCDTGHMSRVAADIMIEDEGFSRVRNLRGGMRAWRRAQARPACWCRRVLVSRWP